MILDNNEKLKNKLALIKKNFDVKEIIKQNQGDEEVIRYYLTNHFAYLVFHNRDGFMHMGISRGGNINKVTYLSL